MEQILEYIGENLHSSRAYIFEDNKDGTYNNTYEWVGEGVTAEKENLQNVPYEGLLDVWFREFEKSKNIIIPDVEVYREISQDVYDILKPQNIHSLVAGPIEINGRYIGFYGVDNPPADHLDSIANLIDIMHRRKQRRSILKKQETDLIDFVNILDIKRKCVIWHTGY